MLQLILMFLLACAALPDEAPDRLDLAAYYEHNRHYFWELFAMVALSAVLANFIAAFRRVPLPTLLLKAVPNLLFARLMLSLAFVRSKSYHSGIICLLLLVMVLGWFPLRLEWTVHALDGAAGLLEPPGRGQTNRFGQRGAELLGHLAALTLRDPSARILGRLALDSMEVVRHSQRPGSSSQGREQRARGDAT
ncbi:MAG TPA: hypothetical protein VK192_08515 [Sphingomicrobium sp.]|nr:hypothetical protein [Sphingomicrobium sp.]